MTNGWAFYVGARECIMMPTDERYPAGVGSGILSGKGWHWAKCRFATQLPLAVGVFGVALFSVALGPVQATTHVYREDFTTTQYKDALNTTAR